MSKDGMMLFVGLEIGGTNLKAGILDGETGKLLGSFRQEPLLSNGSKDVEPEVRPACSLREVAVVVLSNRWRCVQLFFFGFRFSSMYENVSEICAVHLLLAVHLLPMLASASYDRITPII